MRTHWTRYFLGLALLSLFLGLAWSARPTAAAAGSPLHPTFPMLDDAGDHVLTSGRPVSTEQTCGSCHDTAFITEHSFHADVGLSSWTEPGQTSSGRPWDTSEGLFGRWDPLLYRYLSPAGDDVIDMTTAEWLQIYGFRHVGGGPAVFSPTGSRLDTQPAGSANPSNQYVDPNTGELVSWDWVTSGTVEMNCFLCHLDQPDNDARIDALAAGEFAWAGTATLLQTGIVTKTNEAYLWNAGAFTVDGDLRQELVTIRDPNDANCAQCHGDIHLDLNTPLTVAESCTDQGWTTRTTGQIYSPQRLSDSGLNLAEKDELTRSFDIHAERVVACTECHYALNNPIYFRDTDGTQPDHLLFDPRRLDFSDYLYRPLHQFAKGQSAQSALAPELDNSLRQCESCHSIDVTHDWLPYKERHVDAVACASCHTPTLYAPAQQAVDWTVLTAPGEPRVECRGEADSSSTSTLFEGYAPILLARDDGAGGAQLAPYNLITAFYWVYGERARPVPQRDLEAVWFDGDAYAEPIMALFDVNGDGFLDETELRIDSDAKEQLLVDRLTDRDLAQPRIMGEVQPYSISHNVTTGEFATRDCRTCHGEDSRLAQPLELVDFAPGGVEPTLLGSSTVNWSGDFTVAENGSLLYTAAPAAAGLYVLGYSSVDLIDWGGLVLFVATLVGVVAHGGLRYVSARRQAGTAHTPAVREVYMYAMYERLWHWLQTLAIFILLFTGLIIHKPDKFGIFSFSYVVEVHNIVAFILVANAFLALFYHLVSGEIQQFLPRPRGFFGQAIEQSMYYLRGIFRNEPHPFEKSRGRKMNPLQQVTYIGILNVLLPLQILTGMVMWGAQRWPTITAQLGGLPFLAPFHTLIAWLFATFIVMHVYLTTTGHTPMANIRAMMMGWDEVEVHDGATPAGVAPKELPTT